MKIFLYLCIHNRSLGRLSMDTACCVRSTVRLNKYKHNALCLKNKKNNKTYTCNKIIKIMFDIISFLESPSGIGGLSIGAIILIFIIIYKYLLDCKKENQRKEEIKRKRRERNKLKKETKPQQIVINNIINNDSINSNIN